MACKFHLLDKYQLFESNVRFIAGLEKNVLNLDEKTVVRLKEISQEATELIELTDELEDNNQLWSLDIEDTYESLVKEYFEIIRMLSHVSKC